MGQTYRQPILRLGRQKPQSVLFPRLFPNQYLAADTQTHLCLILVTVCKVRPMKIELEQAFATLGVPASASASDVRSAYRTLIRQNHPDHVAGDTSAATQRLAEINAAKDLIDRHPAPSPRQPRRPASQQAASGSSEPNTLTPEQQRARREAEARAFRKAMESRAHAELEAERCARAAAEQAAHRRSHSLDKAEAQKRASDEARRQRQAAFAAALRCGSEAAGPVSLLDRLRSIGSRTSAGI